MKKTLSFVTVLLFALGLQAQMIEMDLVTPTPSFQDADVGDMEFADVDGDGDNDLLLSGKGGPIKTTLYINDGIGNYSEALGTPFEQVHSSTVGFEDVDNDGDPDLLITGRNSSPLESSNLYINDGAGNFTLLPGTPFEPMSGGDFAFGDVDGDSDPDVILSGYDANGMAHTSMYLNNGTGTFALATGTTFEQLRSTALKFIDIENDGDLDLILSGENNNSDPATLLYTNNGTGTFSLAANTPFVNCVGGDIAVGDTDNDGDLDIFLCGVAANNIYVADLYLNNGTGNFSLLAGTPMQKTSLGETGFADFDNDGDLDLFLIGTGDGGLLTNSIIGNIYQNQGGNNFILGDSLIGAYLSSFAVADMDGDNDLDLVTGGTSTGSPVRGTKVYRNVTQIMTALEIKESLGLGIFPNPSTGAFNFESKVEFEAEVQIYNVKGELVMLHRHNSMHSEIMLAQPAGIYFAVITTEKQTATTKLVLEK